MREEECRAPSTSFQMVFLGKIIIPGGVANFCFGREGEIFALNEYRLWRAQLDASINGALLGI